ncbi:hypothetical protein [Microvirga sp. VF16]|nr:hypothetical protein JO965_29230 [Microvirga sp. VF16]
MRLVLYILRCGDPWHLLPHEYSRWLSVYDHLRRRCQRGTYLGHKSDQS